MEYKRLNFIASQAITSHKYKSLRIKLMNCNANIHFNKQCLLHKVIPAYAKLQVPHTSPASHATQHKAQILCIKVPLLEKKII
jgi:hypothetical protein